MSRTLLVALRATKPLDAAAQDDLRALCAIAAASVLPPSLAAHLRLVLRAHEREVSIEPFLGSRALAALLAIPKKRGDALALLTVIVASSFHFAREVRIVLEDAGEPAQAVVPLDVSAMGTVQRWKDPATYVVSATCTTFHFHRVEAKLVAPATVAGGGRARGYFREVLVSAVSLERAKDYVTLLAAKDGGKVVDFGDVEVSPSERLAPGAAEAKGRAYYS